MTQKINKGSDLMLYLILKDAVGKQYRVADVMEFSIKFYTYDTEIFVECSKTSDGTYTNIGNNGILDFVVLNSKELNKLENGILHYEYHLKVKNQCFDDEIYDEVIRGETNFYLG